MASSLEQLPTELHMAILHSIVDTQTLSALVHASPIIHQVYYSNLALQQEIWTQIMIHQLYQRGVDMLSPAPVVEFRAPQGIHGQYRSALTRFFDKVIQGTEPIRLSVHDCRTLLSIRGMAKWDIHEGNPWKLTLRHISNDIFRYWTYYDLEYRTIVLDSNYSPNFKQAIVLLVRREHESLRDKMWIENRDALEGCKDEILQALEKERDQYRKKIGGEGFFAEEKFLAERFYHPKQWDSGRLPDYKFATS